MASSLFSDGDGDGANGNLEAAADVTELHVATPSASSPLAIS